MGTINFIENILPISVSAFVYFFASSVTGYTESLIIDKLGDDSPRRAGFLTLDPFVRLHWIGLMSMMLYQLAWYIPAPIDYLYFVNRRRTGRLILANFARPLANFLVSVVSTIVLLILAQYYNTDSWYYATFFLTKQIGFFDILRTTHNISSLTLIIILLIACIVQVHATLASVSFISKSIQIVLRLIYGWEFWEFAETSFLTLEFVTIMICILTFGFKFFQQILIIDYSIAVSLLSFFGIMG